MVVILEVILSLLITRGLDFTAAARTGEVLELSGQTFSSAISWTPNQGHASFFLPRALLTLPIEIVGKSHGFTLVLEN